MDSFKMPHDESRKIDVLREEVQALRAEVKTVVEENRMYDTALDGYQLMVRDLKKQVESREKTIRILTNSIQETGRQNRWLTAQIKVKDNTITYMNSLLDEEVINEPK